MTISYRDHRFLTDVVDVLAANPQPAEPRWPHTMWCNKEECELDGLPCEMFVEYLSQQERSERELEWTATK